MKEYLFLNKVEQAVIANPCPSERIKKYLLRLIGEERRRIRERSERKQDQTLNSKLPGC